MKVIGKIDSHSESSPELFSHVPRFCYRKDFQPIPPGNFITDRGWGCCYRSIQGLLCQCFLRLKEKYPYRYNQIFHSTISPYFLFYDIPAAPFGIHSLVAEAELLGLNAGEWAKPSLLAVAIQNICKTIHFGCIISHDFTITKSEVDVPYPALLLIPGLFGLNQLDQSLIPFLQLCMCVEDSLGIVSGWKGYAYYIVGFNNTHFAYFDPHTTKPAIVDEQNEDSLYSLSFKKIKYNQLNPSMLLGFLCKTESELNELLVTLMSCTSSPLDFTEPNYEDACKRVLDIDDLGI